MSIDEKAFNEAMANGTRSLLTSEYVRETYAFIKSYEAAKRPNPSNSTGLNSAGLHPEVGQLRDTEKGCDVWTGEKWEHCSRLDSQAHVKAVYDYLNPKATEQPVSGENGQSLSDFVRTCRSDTVLQTELANYDNSSAITGQPDDCLKAYGDWLSDGRCINFYGSYSCQQAFEAGWEARQPEREAGEEILAKAVLAEVNAFLNGDMDAGGALARIDDLALKSAGLLYRRRGRVNTKEDGAVEPKPASPLTAQS